MDLSKIFSNRYEFMQYCTGHPHQASFLALIGVTAALTLLVMSKELFRSVTPLAATVMARAKKRSNPSFNAMAVVAASDLLFRLNYWPTTASAEAVAEPFTLEAEEKRKVGSHFTAYRVTQSSHRKLLLYGPLAARVY